MGAPKSNHIMPMSQMIGQCLGMSIWPPEVSPVVLAYTVPTLVPAVVGLGMFPSDSNEQCPITG